MGLGVPAGVHHHFMFMLSTWATKKQSITQFHTLWEIVFLQRLNFDRNRSHTNLCDMMWRLKRRQSLRTNHRKKKLAWLSGVRKEMLFKEPISLWHLLRSHSGPTSTKTGNNSHFSWVFPYSRLILLCGVFLQRQSVGESFHRSCSWIFPKNTLTWRIDERTNLGSFRDVSLLVCGEMFRSRFPYIGMRKFLLNLALSRSVGWSNCKEGGVVPNLILATVSCELGRVCAVFS